MAETIKVWTVLPVSAKTIYNAWLDSEEHSNFTGGKAVIDPVQGGSFTAWNNYISGKNVKLQPYSRIVQRWRTTDFKDSSRDSLLELLLEKADGGTRITLIHSEIPDGQGKQYEEGWRKHYLKPMKEYFKK